MHCGPEGLEMTLSITEIKVPNTTLGSGTATNLIRNVDNIRTILVYLFHQFKAPLISILMSFLEYEP